MATDEETKVCQTQLKESVELQLSEIEMLKSMFPNTSEFCIDEDIVEAMRHFIEGSTILLPKLEYCIHLSSDRGKVTLHAAFPASYPQDTPDIYVRSDQLSREAQRNLNKELSSYMNTLEEGDLVVGAIIAWLQEHNEEYLTAETKETKAPDKPSVSTKGENFLRLWIYSHHIYSKVKRKDIKKLAEEYHLTGFCLPGKPGIMCVEGQSKNVNDWWHMVRSWNWQKILCKKQEEKKINEPEEISKLQRFQDFQELGPTTNIRIKSSGFHVDMGDLFRYLENHNSGYMFEEYFGVSGRNKLQ